MNPPAPVWRRIRALVVGATAALAIMAAAMVIDRLALENDAARLRSEVTATASQVRAHLEGELNATMNLCLGLVAYAGMRERIDPEEFEQLAAMAIAQARHVRNVALAPDNVVRFVYPLKGNERAIGLRYLDTPGQRDLVVRAMNTGKAVVAGPVALAQGGNGIINRVPIYARASGRGERRYWGIASIVLDVDSIFGASGLTAESGLIRYALRGRDGMGASGEVFFGSPQLFSADAVLLELRLAGDARWQLAAFPAGGWAQAGGNLARWTRIGVAGLLALSLALAVGFWLRDKDLLERRVRERTAALEQSNRDLRQAMDQLVHSEKLASLGGLVAGIAHELNTPIGNALMVASTLREEAEGMARDVRAGSLRRSVLEAHVERVREASEMLLRNLLRGGELIGSFKQVAVDQASSRQRRFRLAALVDEIALTLRPTLKRTSYRLTWEIPAGLELDSYPGPLGQVLTNLIVNAVTHGFDGRPDGEILIRAEMLDGARVRVSVRDDGKGMDSKTVKRVFEPFFTTKLGSGGSGLGLFLVYSIVRGPLGGQITLQSTPGAGTEFAMELPLKAPPQAGGPKTGQAIDPNIESEAQVSVGEAVNKSIAEESGRLNPNG